MKKWRKGKWATRSMELDHLSLNNQVRLLAHVQIFCWYLLQITSQVLEQLFSAFSMFRTYLTLWLSKVGMEPSISLLNKIPRWFGSKCYLDHILRTTVLKTWTYRLLNIVCAVVLDCGLRNIHSNTMREPWIATGSIKTSKRCSWFSWAKF